MDQVRRVIVHDKPPILEPEMFARRANRIVLAVAAVSLVIQAGALIQVIRGAGFPETIFAHAMFAVVSLLWLGLGVLVFLQRRNGRSGRLFLLSASAGSAFLSLCTLYNASMINALLFAVGLLFFPPLMLSFTRAFQEVRPFRRAELLLYLPPLILLWPSAVALSHRDTTVPYRVTMALVGLFMVAAIAQAIRDLLAARTTEQAAQSRALVLGLVAGTIPGVITFVIPLVVTRSLAVPTTWLPPIILVFLIAMSYSVLLFEFSEADLIVRRGIVYGVLTLVIVVAYGVLGVLLPAGTTAISPAGGLGFVVVTLLIGAAFAPIRRAALRFVNLVLYGRRTDRWALLQALSARLARVMQPDELGEVLVREIADALHLRGAFLLARVGKDFVLQHAVEPASRSSTRYDPIPADLCLDGSVVAAALGDPPEPVLIVHRKPATAAHRGELPDRYRTLDDLHAALSIPFVTRSGLEAVLCLQPKLAHDAFDADDLELLAPVIRQATAAMDNSLLFARLEEKVDELRDAYRRIAREQEAERARLARELHDGTAQELAGLITLATVAERQMTGDDGPVRVTLERLRHQAEDAYQDVRRATHALRPLMLDDFGLVPTLDRYLTQFGEATGISIDYVAGDMSELSDDVELALFRVVQECMENVRKHSGAHAAAIRLRQQDGHVHLSVSDDGRGMAVDGERGIGMAGMRERVAAVGGDVRVENAEEGGVRIEVDVPAAETWKTTVSELS